MALVRPSRPWAGATAILIRCREELGLSLRDMERLPIPSESGVPRRFSRDTIRRLLGMRRKRVPDVRDVAPVVILSAARVICAKRRTVVLPMACYVSVLIDWKIDDVALALSVSPSYVMAAQSAMKRDAASVQTAKKILEKARSDEDSTPR